MQLSTDGSNDTLVIAALFAPNSVTSEVRCECTAVQQLLLFTTAVVVLNLLHSVMNMLEHTSVQLKCGPVPPQLPPAGTLRLCTCQLWP